MPTLLIICGIPGAPYSLLINLHNHPARRGSQAPFYRQETGSKSAKDSQLAGIRVYLKPSQGGKVPEIRRAPGQATRVLMCICPLSPDVLVIPDCQDRCAGWRNEHRSESKKAYQPQTLPTVLSLAVRPQDGPGNVLGS